MERMSNYLPYEAMYVITYPCADLRLSMLVKRGPDRERYNHTIY